MPFNDNLDLKRLRQTLITHIYDFITYAYPMPVTQAPFLFSLPELDAPPFPSTTIQSSVATFVTIQLC